MFKSGNSQAVRIPRDFQFDVDEVEILRRGNEIVLRKMGADLTRAYELLTRLPEDFMGDGRENAPPEARESF